MFVMAYWIFWSLSIVIGIQMFIRDKGLVWERTEKVDANHDLVRDLELVAIAVPGADVIDQTQLEHPTADLTLTERPSRQP